MATTVRVSAEGELLEGRARRRRHVHWQRDSVQATSDVDPLALSEADAHAFCFPPPLNAFVLPNDVVFCRPSGSLRAADVLELVHACAADAGDDADDEVVAEVPGEEADVEEEEAEEDAEEVEEAEEAEEAEDDEDEEDEEEPDEYPEDPTV